MKPYPARAFAVLPNGQWPTPIVAAFKALGEGQARHDQQKMAVEFIVEAIAGTYDLSFRPDDLGGERETAFAEGRRFVGLELRRAISESFETLTGKAGSGEKPS